MKKSKVYAVLTGDLVASSQIPANEYDALLYALDQTLRYLCRRDAGQYNVYRGDAFQLLLNKPQAWAHSAILLRLAMRSQLQDCRLSVGIGTISNPRPDVKSATGEAFTLSGTGLDSLPQGQRMNVQSTEDDFNWHMGITLRQTDALISQMTVRQAQALQEYLLLEDKSHLAVAKHLHTSRVNATKLLNQGHYDLLMQVILYSEQLTDRYFHG
ncbi:hypothetical protein [Bowmanella yangjiangensis]|uniref:Transcriptional regulator n=1 Tax=Bowmanella yangjiangensis TaxID=2811230 RepID=A0ABS3CZJ7_9ALTE|nr:hypothetical protein [Bowmanella yangjiangensis]MBN7821551.1 hypothetical protein [Bowmanella yangjiangensis]